MKLCPHFKMTMAVTASIALAGAATLLASAAKADSTSASILPVGSPALQKNGDAVQLVVDGKPFLMLAGELNNSSSSNLTNMEPIWTHMNKLHANTVLTPLSWAMIEPKEGTFDFRLVDGLIRGARAHNLHLVFLWLASWKNGMSCYDPIWVKSEYQRFPRAEHRDGTPRQVLSTLSKNNWTADATAFAALMKHIRQVDGQEHTVLMMQVENEVGILGDSRDRSPEANAAYDGPVPTRLMDYLVKNEAELTPGLKEQWVKAGQKTSGTWEQVFGPGPTTDEMFMAWHYSRYVDHVAAAGKAEYPIPMYANAWLNDPMDSPPGNFPSGCPESNMMDVWKAGAPHIDLLAPDLYAGNFEERCQLYTRIGNTLFIPEMNSDLGGARNVYLAIGKYDALGTSPFGVDHTPSDGPFGDTYGALSQVAPLLLKHQGKGETTGFVLDSNTPQVNCDMNGYEVEISLDSVFGHTASNGAGVVIAIGPNEFLGAGSGFRVAFRPLTPGPEYAGIGIVQQGTFDGEKWIPGLTLNGDQTDQGRGWRFDSFQTSIEKCTVYRYGKNTAP